MEDYQAAFLQRLKDVETLDQAGRRAAAMHFGGVVVECLLKYMILITLPKNAKREWKTETNDPGHTFMNPGHSYKDALGCLNQIRFSVERQERWVQKWFDDVEHPGRHFIDMRYSGEEPDEIAYKKWRQSYKSLLGWLQKQAGKL